LLFRGRPGRPRIGDGQKMRGLTAHRVLGTSSEGCRDVTRPRPSKGRLKSAIHIARRSTSAGVAWPARQADAVDRFAAVGR
jgi:hypothetical protein